MQEVFVYNINSTNLLFHAEIIILVLTYADLVSTIPFANTLDTLEMRGDHFLEAIEYAAAKSWDEDRFNGANMIQFSGNFFFLIQERKKNSYNGMGRLIGLKIVYDVTKPVGSRAESVDVLCNKCKVPQYFPLAKNETYRIITGSFMASGGDGFDMFVKYGQNYR